MESKEDDRRREDMQRVSMQEEHAVAQIVEQWSSYQKVPSSIQDPTVKILNPKLFETQCNECVNG